MVREKYHEELAKVQQMVLILGELVGTSIKNSVEALCDHNIEQAEVVIKGDAEIDDHSAKIE
ncbi:MAG: phosphate transport system regulatory protein PhoU, partial [Methanosarcinales archaeon]|nr:phosphate transport system regulatory protein PhoU [Methanosarcinales archaeon]